MDARLKDGSRVNAIIPPLAIDGPSMSIRRFAVDLLNTQSLVQMGTLTPAITPDHNLLCQATAVRAEHRV